jgi:monovalent cation:H+ antiporter, CPA1 family
MSELAVALRFMLAAAAVSIVTERLRVPYTIGLVVAGLVTGSLHLAPPITVTPEVLLTLLIPPLLFEGGLRLPPTHLKAYGGLIALLAIPGTLLTALAIGAAALSIFPIGLQSALLLGAIISAIDPVSVLAFMREARIDARLASIVEGEAVLNDGVAIILFTIVGGGAAASLTHAGLQFVWLLGGGAAVGGLVALAISFILGRTQQPLVEALGSLIAALGALLAANSIGASGVIAVITAGVVFGSYGRRHLTESGLETVQTTWDVIAFLANSVLFLLIGLAAPAALLSRYWLLIIVVIAAALAARAAIVYGFTAFRWTGGHLFPNGWRTVLVWSGLRGGVAIALALELDRATPAREPIVAAAFGVVLFTLLVQGSSVRPMMRWAGLEPGGCPNPSGGRRRAPTR